MMVRAYLLDIDVAQLHYLVRSRCRVFIYCISSPSALIPSALLAWMVSAISVVDDATLQVTFVTVTNLFLAFHL